MRYSQTSLYRTRIIRTSAYIEITLWSRPPAIVTDGKGIGFIEHGYIEFSAISSMQHHPTHVHGVVYIEVNTSDSRQLPAVGRSAGEMRHHTPPCQCHATDPPLWRALMHCKEVNVFHMCIFPLSKPDECKWCSHYSHCDCQQPTLAIYGRWRQLRDRH